MGDEKDTEKDEAPKKESARESMAWIVGMMNEGKADPKQVYPGGGRYHGD